MIINIYLKIDVKILLQRVVFTKLQMASSNALQLKYLFHTLPDELKEIILRFTYKTQNKQLLAEIQTVAEAKYYLQEFTRMIDTANSSFGFAENSETIFDRLWPGLNFLRENPNTNQLIKKWKYKSSFYSANRDHVNCQQSFRHLIWESSFALHFWMCIYH